MFQSCTVTRKDPSLPSTGSALRWNSGHMVCSCQYHLQSLVDQTGIFASFVSVVPDEKWTELDAEQHRAHAMRLLDGLEVTAREKRLKVARAILYMAQGETSVK